ncbi:MAG TPA: glycosyltransferase [Accumulibacter sp.]|nr:glycosyltransferase [Accumulibacter sp.]HMW18565.1 glycosyltransferase [Accumulibacter sp.]HMX22182.1 glycosyltransferase [Accumulibacter sp.]HMY07210.1 glycosyltransferase [Accumulibacter sp.]HNC17726.1 glycosyltransferase [Accumulibacter sp.]
MKRVLMVAFHFPPFAGSSGIQRTLRFMQHLPRFGWQPLMLSADPRAYEQCSDDLLSEIPPETVVRRAFALDAARQLAIGGRYIGWTARPDRWMLWKFAGVRAGLQMIKSFSPDAIWTTYPIATAHVIGAELHRRTGVPWLADFRDPMAQDDYPKDPLTWQSFKRIETRTVNEADLSIFTTPGAARVYRQRYPDAKERIIVLENGYDEESFASSSGASTPSAEPLNAGAITLLHSGIVYPEERDPSELIAALRLIKERADAVARNLKIRFRASGHDYLLKELAEKHGVQEMIECCPSVPYRQALSEMLRADGLLVMQSSGCNEQIPAKIYEYLRAGRPIVALTDPVGDTATTLQAAGVIDIAPLDSAARIAELLIDFANRARRGDRRLPNPDAVRRASRLGRTQELVELLETVGR